MRLFVVGTGGFVGAVARYAVAGLVQRLGNGGFPIGTLAVNLLGCLLIGALMALVEERQALGPDARLFLLVGLLGSFTTFSTFEYETWGLLRDGQVAAALLNAAGSVTLGLLGVLAGRTAILLLARTGG